MGERVDQNLFRDAQAGERLLCSGSMLYDLSNSLKMPSVSVSKSKGLGFSMFTNGNIHNIDLLDLQFVGINLATF